MDAENKKRGEQGVREWKEMGELRTGRASDPSDSKQKIEKDSTKKLKKEEVR